jgi:acyl dehydratase
MCSDWANPLQFHSFSVKFKKMVRPGETVICTGKIAKKKEDNGLKLLHVDITALNEEGEVKVAGELIIKCD